MAFGLFSSSGTTGTVHRDKLSCPARMTGTGQGLIIVPVPVILSRSRYDQIRQFCPGRSVPVKSSRTNEEVLAAKSDGGEAELPLVCAVERSRPKSDTCTPYRYELPYGASRCGRFSKTGRIGPRHDTRRFLSSGGVFRQNRLFALSRVGRTGLA